LSVPYSDQGRRHVEQVITVIWQKGRIVAAHRR